MKKPEQTHSAKDQKKSGKEIDVDQIDLDLMKERTTDLPGLIEYAHSVGGFSIIPTEDGMIKNKAINAMQEQTEQQVKQIYEQMQLLAKQVQDIQKRADVSLQIYQAEIKFTPTIGQSYYLYETENAKKYLSMISPDEWGKRSDEKKFIAKVKLLSDHTWKIEEDFS